MRKYVISDGKAKKVDHIERGRLLLRNEGEWLDRAKRLEINQYILFGGIYVMVYPATILPLRMALGPETALSDHLLYILLFLVLFFAIFFPIMRVLINPVKRYQETGIVPGMYQFGIELPLMSRYVSRFLPYSEIGKVEVRRVLGRKFNVLRYRVGRGRLGYPSWYLGDDGLAIIERIIHGVPVIDGPPKLVLYGPPGARQVPALGEEREGRGP